MSLATVVTAAGPATAINGVGGSSQWPTAVSGSFNAAGTMTFGISGVTAALNTGNNGCGAGSPNQVTNAVLISRMANNFYDPIAPTDAVGVFACQTGAASSRTVTFNKPIIGPVFHINNLDGSRLDFLAGPSGGAIELTTVKKNTPLLLLNGGTTLQNTYQMGTANCSDTAVGNNPGCGSFRMTEAGGPVTSFAWSNPTIGTADGWFWALSFPMADVTKAFSPSTVPAGQTSQLTFTITNPNGAGATDLSPLDFADGLPSGLTIADGTVTDNGGCGTPVVTAAGGGPLATGETGVEATNISVDVDATCTITVNVTGSVTGSYTNDDSNMSTTVGNLIPDPETSTTLTITAAAPAPSPTSPVPAPSPTSPVPAAPVVAAPTFTG